LVLLAVPELPWIFLTPDKAVEQFGNPPELAEAIWIGNLIDVVGFLGAAVLAALRIRFWPAAAVAMCGYMAAIATPPFLHMGMSGGIMKY
jgi:hypothetical protein